MSSAPRASPSPHDSPSRHDLASSSALQLQKASAEEESDLSSVDFHETVPPEPVAPPSFLPFLHELGLTGSGVVGTSVLTDDSEEDPVITTERLKWKLDLLLSPNDEDLGQDGLQTPVYLLHEDDPKIRTLDDMRHHLNLCTEQRKGRKKGDISDREDSIMKELPALIKEFAEVEGELARQQAMRRGMEAHLVYQTALLLASSDRIIASDLLYQDDDFFSHSIDGMDKKKAWKDIWGCGQGIGAVKSVLSCKHLVDRIISEYDEAKERLNKIS